jgi:peptide/nickel transport system substrate-binding protein
MPSVSPFRKRTLAIVGGAAALSMIMVGCAASDSDDDAAATGGDLIVGTTEQVTALDPAGSYDNGSFGVQNQVFPFLLNSPLNSPDVEPDIAASAEFTAPNDYTVVLKPDLKFFNGNDLTASDVKFTFDRQLAIANENGPSSLLYNLESTEVVDDLTVVFHLILANDQVFPQILSSPVGPIVDEETFSATELTSDDDIVAGGGFAGQYTITSYELNTLVEFEPNPEYQGLLGPAENDSVTLSYYTDSSNMKLDVQEGEIDVAYRSLSATDVEDLRGNDDVKVIDGPGGEIQYVVFNFDTQPFGATTPEADPAKALAVRQAVADLVDRQEIATQVFKDTYTPLYSYVPDGLTGATESLKGLYGDGSGGPDVDKATAALADAGVTTPVVLNLQYVAERYGPSWGDAYALVKDQLESSGLFTVNIQATEWVQYREDRVADLYPAYQLGWFPDYSDADNYLTPFFLTENFLSNHYDNPEVNQLILDQAVTVDPAERTALIEEIQDKVAADLSTVPLLQGAQLAVTGADVDGLVLDASFKFRFATLVKG